MSPRFSMDPYPGPEAEPQPEVGTTLLIPLFRLPMDEPRPAGERERRVRRLRLVLSDPDRSPEPH